MRGAFLLEQMVSIGLLGLLLVMVAAVTVQNGRGGRSAQRGYEGQVIAQNLLETHKAGAVSLLPLGTLPAVTGRFTDQTPYTATTEVYSLGGAGFASGLTDNDLKGVRVTVTWRDVTGTRQARCEGLLARLPR